MIRAATILVPTALAACAPQPMTPERAERICREQARQADGVSGRIGVGVGSGGPRGRASITLTNRLGNPQSEGDFIAQCVARRLAGQPEPPTVGITLSNSF